MLKYYIEQIFVLFKPLIKKILRKPAIIFKIDGGTCSQMADIVYIKMIEEKTGKRVLADFSWFDSCEKDENSVVARPFNVDKLFDFDKCEIATKFELWIYKLLFPYFPTEDDMKENGISVDLMKFVLPEPPRYMYGYYYLKDDIFDKNWTRFLKLKRAEEILDSKNMELYNQIQHEEKSVGVHVRRGDMAFGGGYWKILPAEYFINVCNMAELQGFTFYFFSEEPEWIRENILPYVNIKYELAANNSSYYGYRDLFLLSCCKYQVQSQGSFGRFAYLLNENRDKRLIGYNEKKKDLWEWSEGDNR